MATVAEQKLIDAIMKKREQSYMTEDNEQPSLIGSGVPDRFKPTVQQLPATQTYTPQQLPATQTYTPQPLQTPQLTQSQIFDAEATAARNTRTFNQMNDDGTITRTDTIVTPEQRQAEIPRATQPTQDNGGLSSALRDQIFKAQSDYNAQNPQFNNPNSQVAQSITPKPAINLSEMISQKYSANTNSIVSALKQKIAESKASQEALKQQAPQQYDPLRAQSEVAKNQSLRSVLERNANLGDRGGIGRSEALATQTAGENRLGAIGLQQQNFIDTANNEIARLESQGKFQEAQIIAEEKAKEIDALINEQRVQENRTYNEGLAEQERLRDDTRLASDRAYQAELLKGSQAYQQGLTTDQRAYNERLDAQQTTREDALTAQKLADKTTTDNQQRELDTIGQYSNDYQAEINRRQETANTADDWLIPYLKDVRGQKMASIEQGKVAAEKTAYERALKEKELSDKQALERLKLQQAKEMDDADRKIAQQKANKITAPKATKPTAQPMW